MYQKLLAGILTAACILNFSTATVSADNVTGTVASYTANREPVSVEAGVQPRFTLINSISARMVQSKGKATITGSATLKNRDNKAVLTLTVERSKDNKNWEYCQSWSGTATGNIVLALERFYYLEKGYGYRSRTIVDITSGSTHEIVPATSSVVYY